MKKIFTIAIALVSMGLAMAAPVDRNTAKNAAEAFWTNYVGVYGTASTKAAFDATANFGDIAAELGYSELYIFNNQTGSGFVVIAGDDAVRPVLAYSATDNFATENLPENVKYWMDSYESAIAYVKQHGIGATSEVEKMWNDLKGGSYTAAKSGRKSVDALTTTRWDQYPLYNNMCPLDGNTRTVTGCGATAMAQVLKYWNYPAQGQGTHTDQNQIGPMTGAGGAQTVDFGATTYDWANMPEQLTGASSQTEITAVATLMYHCGVSIDMVYTTQGSGATSATIAPALMTHFRYSNSAAQLTRSGQSDETWNSILQSELDRRRPVIYNGYDMSASTQTMTIGHCFVCDGYDNSGMYHFNFGWSGSCNGFYALDNIVTEPGGMGGNTYNFSDNQDIIYGIQPILAENDSVNNLGMEMSVALTLDSSSYQFGSDINYSATVTNGGSGDQTGCFAVFFYDAANALAYADSNYCGTIAVGDEVPMAGTADGGAPFIVGEYTAKVMCRTNDGQWALVAGNGMANSVSFTVTRPPAQTANLKVYSKITTKAEYYYENNISAKCTVINMSSTDAFVGRCGYRFFDSNDQFVCDYGCDRDQTIPATQGAYAGAAIETFNLPAHTLPVGTYTVKLMYSLDGGMTWIDIEPFTSSASNTATFRVTDVNGIDEAEKEEMNAYADNRRIYVTGCDGDVTIYDPMGRVVYNGTGREGVCYKAVAKGLYIVRANNVAKKVLVY